MKQSKNQIKIENNRQHAIKISEKLLFKLHQFLGVLRSIEEASTRESFIENSIIKKLSKEISLSPTELGIYRRISFRMSEDLSNKIDKVVAIKRRLGRSITKSDWVVEAIAEELDEHEKKETTALFDKDFLKTERSLS